MRRKFGQGGMTHVWILLFISVGVTSCSSRLNAVLNIASTKAGTSGSSSTPVSFSWIGEASVALNEWLAQGNFTANSSTDGTFNSPSSVAVDPTGGFFYVAEEGNHRIQKFNLTTGAFIGAIGNLSGASVGTCPISGAAGAWCTGGVFTNGAGDGMFNNPASIALDATHDRFYVADTSNSRIQKFVLSTGAFLGAIGDLSATGGTGGVPCPASGAAPGWCTSGTFTSAGGDGMFMAPVGLAVDPAGALYVSDGSTHEISKFDLNSGAFIGAIGHLTATGATGSSPCPASGAAPGWCTSGTFAMGGGDGMFDAPNQIALDLSNTSAIYVTDTNNDRVVKIDLASGAFVGAIGNLSATGGTGSSPCPASGAAPGWCTSGSFASGAADGMFSSASGIAIDPSGNALYVADSNNNRVNRFTLTTGAPMGAIGNSISYLYSSNQQNDPETFSLSTWIKTTTQNGGVIMGFAQMGSVSDPTTIANWDRNLYMLNSGQISFGVHNSNSYTVLSPSSYNDGQWHHVVATYTANSMILYVDGSAVASTTANVANAIADSGYWLVGYNRIDGDWPTQPNSPGFHGSIDDVGIWNSVLSASDVNTMYTGGALSAGSPQWGSIFAAWHLDEASGSSYVDASPNGNNATAYGPITDGVSGKFSNGITIPDATTGWLTGSSFFTAGAEGGMFNNPEGLAFDSAHNILYGVDFGNSRIETFSSPSGAYVDQLGGAYQNELVAPWSTSAARSTQASTDGAFSSPWVGRADLSGNLYVVDSGNNRVEKFTANGTFVGAIGALSGPSSGGASPCPSSGAAPGWCTGGSFTTGAADGMFNDPYDLAVDSTRDLLYVSDFGNNRILKFVLSSGAYVGAVGNLSATGGTGSAPCPASGAAPSWCTSGTFTIGAGNGMFYNPMGLDIDVTNNFLYVSDWGNNRVEKLNLATGAMLGGIGNSISYLYSSNQQNDPETFSLSAWIKTTTHDGGVIMGFANIGTFSDPTTISNWDRNLYMLNSGQIRFGVCNSGIFTVLSPASYNDGQWHHVVATYTANSMILYVDGAAVASTTTNVANAFPDSGYWLVGYNRIDGSWPTQPNSPGFHGSIDDVGIWNSVLSAGDVNTIYTGGALSAGSPQWGSVFAAWHLDEASGSSYADASGNNHGATAQGPIIDGVTGKFSNGITLPGGGGDGWISGLTYVTAGPSDGIFSSPAAVAIDSNHDLFYVADLGNFRIEKFVLSTGAFVGAIGNLSATNGTGNTPCPASGAALSWCTGGIFGVGSADGMFGTPSGLAVDVANGYLYVSDANSNQVDKLALSTGAFIGAIGELSSSTGTCPASGPATSWCTGGTFMAGLANGMFNQPRGLSLDAFGNLFISDSNNSRMIKVTQ